MKSDGLKVVRVKTGGWTVAAVGEDREVAVRGRGLYDTREAARATLEEIRIMVAAYDAKQTARATA